MRYLINLGYILMEELIGRVYYIILQFVFLEIGMYVYDCLCRQIWYIADLIKKTQNAAILYFKPNQIMIYRKQAN
jgi:hypothetical protein